MTSHYTTETLCVSADDGTMSRTVEQMIEDQRREDYAMNPWEQEAYAHRLPNWVGVVAYLLMYGLISVFFLALVVGFMWVVSLV